MIDDVYVKTTEKYEQDSSLEEIRKNVLKKLEDGNSEITGGDKYVVFFQTIETCCIFLTSLVLLELKLESQIIRSGSFCIKIL